MSDMESLSKVFPCYEKDPFTGRYKNMGSGGFPLPSPGIGCYLTITVL